MTRVLDLERENHHPTRIAQALRNLAIIVESIGDLDTALKFYLEALDSLEHSTDELEKIRVRLSLSHLYARMQRLDEAENILSKVDSSFLRQIGDLYYQAIAANNLGSIFLQKKQLTQAET